MTSAKIIKSNISTHGQRLSKDYYRPAKRSDVQVLSKFNILEHTGTVKYAMPFHFQSVSGPQPYVVIASELNEWSSLHAIVQRVLPESFLQDFIPFLGCGSGGHSTEMRKIDSTLVCVEN